MPSYTAQTPALRRVQLVDYTPDSTGRVPAQAYFETTLVNDDDPTDKVVKPWKEVPFTVPAEVATQLETLARAALPPVA